MRLVPLEEEEEAREPARFLAPTSRGAPIADCRAQDCGDQCLVPKPPAWSAAGADRRRVRQPLFSPASSGPVSSRLARSWSPASWTAWPGWWQAVALVVTAL